MLYLAASSKSSSDMCLEPAVRSITVSLKDYYLRPPIVCDGKLFRRLAAVQLAWLFVMSSGIAYKIGPILSSN